MTLQQLLYVLTVSDEKSMNKAAEKLFVSQPTLTSAIQSLEKELDIQIYNRTSHGVTVTQQGQEFLTYARQLYQQYELLKNRYEDVSLRRNKFRVSCQHYSFATKAFVDTVKKYGTSKYDFAISETKTMHVIGDVGNFVILDATSNPNIALMDCQLPGFFRVGNRVGAPFGVVAVFSE